MIEIAIFILKLLAVVVWGGVLLVMLGVVLFIIASLFDVIFGNSEMRT